jgi:hypothetical protein
VLKNGLKYLARLVLFRAGPNWANFAEIQSIRAQSQILGHVHPLALPRCMGRDVFGCSLQFAEVIDFSL